jgi:hypothetical protein
MVSSARIDGSVARNGETLRMIQMTNEGTNFRNWVEHDFLRSIDCSLPFYQVRPLRLKPV